MRYQPRITFEYSAVFRNVKKFFDERGDNVQVHAGLRSTAELIMRLYINQVHARQLPVYSPLPDFQTTCESLAKCKGCSSRTIRNHRDRLQAMGFLIQDYIYQGRGIGLRLNLALFEGGMLSTARYGDSKISVDKPLTANKNKRATTGHSRVFTHTGRKKFPPLVHEHIEHNSNSTVDKPPVLAKTSENKDTEKNVIPAEQKGRSAQGAGHIFFTRLVENCWEKAQSALYPGRVFKADAVEKIKKQISRGVYRDFTHQATLEEWREYHQTVLRRIAMVKKWLSGDASRWLPSPLIYFDPGNAHGFIKTWEWFLRAELVRLECKTYQARTKNFKGLQRYRCYDKAKKKVLSYPSEELAQRYDRSLKQYRNQIRGK